MGAQARAAEASIVLEERKFVYVKYWKPMGVTCTSDPSDPSNVIAAGGFNLFPQRLFTVGRLDKDSTGLLLLTSGIPPSLPSFLPSRLLFLFILQRD